MDAKQLKKLAKECRKAGIKKYTCAEFSFELTDDAPMVPVRRKSMIKLDTSTMKSDTPIASEHELTEEQLLMWSAGGEAQ